jgi:hypothetical protein
MLGKVVHWNFEIVSGSRYSERDQQFRQPSHVIVVTKICVNLADTNVDIRL